MLGNGYFIGSKGAGTAINDNDSSDLRLNKDGNIVYSPADPIYIDESELVYFNDEEKNAVMYMEGNNVYVERVGV